jgi:hypothetical protein
MQKTNCPKKREVESPRAIQGFGSVTCSGSSGIPDPLTALNPIQELPLFLCIYHLHCAPTTLRSFTPVAPLHHGSGSLPSASFLLPFLSTSLRYRSHQGFRIEMASPRCADRGLLRHPRDWLLARLQRSLQEGGCGDGFRG